VRGGPESPAGPVEEGRDTSSDARPGSEHHQVLTRLGLGTTEVLTRLGLGTTEVLTRLGLGTTEVMTRRGVGTNRQSSRATAPAPARAYRYEVMPPNWPPVMLSTCPWM
jgi:hypothetical protein